MVVAQELLDVLGLDVLGDDLGQAAVRIGASQQRLDRDLLWRWTRHAPDYRVSLSASAKLNSLSSKASAVMESAGRHS